MVVYRFEPSEVSRAFLLDKNAMPEWSTKLFGKEEVQVDLGEVLSSLENQQIYPINGAN